jgi:hypothetical protein
MKSSMKSIWAVALVMLISFSACEDNKDPEDTGCNLETNASEFSEESLNVTYKIIATGDVKVTSFFYFDETGKVEVQNPTLPYEKEVTLSSQKTIQASALGKVTNGSIKVSYKGIGQNTTYESYDICAQTSK